MKIINICTLYLWEHWNEALQSQHPEHFCVITSPAFKLLRFSPVSIMKTVNMPSYNSLQWHSLGNFQTWAFSVQFFRSVRNSHSNTWKRSLHTLWRLSFGFEDGDRSNSISFLLSHHLRGYIRKWVKVRNNTFTQLSVGANKIMYNEMQQPFNCKEIIDGSELLFEFLIRLEMVTTLIVWTIA